MAGSLYVEETVLKYVLIKKETPPEITQVWLGLSSYTEAELVKKIKGKEFGEKEPTEANAWRRVEVGTAAKPGWTVVKEEGEKGFTKYENTNAIKTGAEKFEFKKVSAGSVECKTFGLFDAEKEGNALVYGTLTTPIVVNSAASLEIAAKALKIECE